MDSTIEVFKNFSWLFCTPILVQLQNPIGNDKMSFRRLKDVGFANLEDILPGCRKEIS